MNSKQSIMIIITNILQMPHLEQLIMLIKNPRIMVKALRGFILHPPREGKPLSRCSLVWHLRGLWNCRYTLFVVFISSFITDLPMPLKVRLRKEEECERNGVRFYSQAVEESALEMLLFRAMPFCTLRNQQRKLGLVKAFCYQSVIETFPFLSLNFPNNHMQGNQISVN